MIAGPSCGDVDTTVDFGEEFSIEVRKQDSDGMGAAGDEASRPAMGYVAEPSGDITDSTAGFFADRGSAVENTGYSSDRDVRFTRDVPDGGHGSCRGCRPVLGCHAM